MRQLILLLIKIYQKVFSPWLGQHCRFYPTCSCYAHEAVSKYGSLKGSWLAIKRLSRCHPWNPGGIDPVPESGKPEFKKTELKESGLKEPGLKEKV